MEYTYYINGVQCSEWDFLQEMVDSSARLNDFVRLVDGYTYTAGKDMFWVRRVNKEYKKTLDKC